LNSNTYSHSVQNEWGGVFKPKHTKFSNTVSAYLISPVDHKLQIQITPG